MSITSQYFGRSQLTVLLFSSVVLAIKYLDITKFGILELGPNSDKSLAVGALGFAVIFFLIVPLVSVLQEYIDKYIDDGNIGSPTIPDFSRGNDHISGFIISLRFISSYVMFFVLRFIPIIFGVFSVIMVRKDIFYFFSRLWELLISGEAA